MAYFSLSGVSDTTIVVTAILFCYATAVTIWRVHLSPLARYPGPKLAALSWWYEFYFDVIKHGQYFKEIDRLHSIYGTIIRINPSELHIYDPDWYGELYTNTGRPRDKSSWYVDGFDGSVFSAVPHGLHRLRRSALDPFFSKRSIEAVGPLIQEKVDVLCREVQTYITSGQAVDLQVAYMALTIDIISEYAFGESFGLLNKPKFSPEWKTAILGQFEATIPLRHFPWLGSILRILPQSVAAAISKPIAFFLRTQKIVRKHVVKVLQGKEKATAAHRTLLEGLRDSDLPPEEKAVERLTGEGTVLVGAGSETTTQTLSVMTFHLLKNPEILQQLKAELYEAIPDPSTSLAWQKLEQLPYLKAVIKEGHRIAAVITARLIRIAPFETLKYKNWEIPPGTPVSMTSHFIHLDPTIFPSPHKFDPNRWLGTPEETARLEKYLVPFCKGAQACVASNLANAELCLTLASMIRRFKFELFETTIEDVKITWDNFAGGQRPESKGIRVKVIDKEV